MTYQQPNKDGFFGEYGGRFVPETLMTAVLELEQTYRTAIEDSDLRVLDRF
jgi:tryptophan synthase beta chain